MKTSEQTGPSTTGECGSRDQRDNSTSDEVLTSYFTADTKRHAIRPHTSLTTNHNVFILYTKVDKFFWSKVSPSARLQIHPSSPEEDLSTLNSPSYHQVPLAWCTSTSKQLFSCLLQQLSTARTKGPQLSSHPQGSWSRRIPSSKPVCAPQQVPISKTNNRNKQAKSFIHPIHTHTHKPCK